MIDVKKLRDDPELIRQSLVKRGSSGDIVDQALSLDEKRRAAILEFDELRSEQRLLSKQIPTAQGEEKRALLSRTKVLAARVKVAGAAQTEAAAAVDAVVAQIPNLVHPDAPSGGENDYVVLEHVGEPRDFTVDGFEPRDHVELGKMLKAIDIERGVKVSGARFYYLTGIGAQLELALVQMAMKTAADWGFIPMIPPALVKPSAMEGTGFLGQAADDVYHLEKDDLYL
ncbi:MAG TPA: serine--tRNA ligase, partial [Actinopolymorphaceae bacterium]